MLARLLLIGSWLCLWQSIGHAQTLSFREKYEDTPNPAAPILPPPVWNEAQPVPAATQTGLQLTGQAEPDGRVRLRWHTGSAHACHTFLLERATDDLLWQPLA
jgi:hypothetical protein